MRIKASTQGYIDKLRGAKVCVLFKTKRTNDEFFLAEQFFEGSIVSKLYR